MSETERLSLICEAVAFSRSARLAGSPVVAYSRAVREVLFTLWESYGRSKHASARYRSRGSIGENVGRADLIYDHAIPLTLVLNELQAVEELRPENIQPILDRRLAAALITMDENKRLTSLGLRSRMPDGWDGVDQLARYRAAGIEVFEQASASTSAGNNTGVSVVVTDRLLKRTTPSSLVLRAAEDHPRLQASSALVKSSWALIWEKLQGHGFALAPTASRDGFVIRRESGDQFRIDPKSETLRIKVGPRPRVSPPAELVHHGRQPDWLVVTPSQAALAADYLVALSVD